MRRASAAVSVLLATAVPAALAACAGASPHGPSPVSSASASGSSAVVDLDALDRRELEGGLAPRHVVLPYPAAAFDVEASASPELARVGESTKVTIPIGTKLPVECYFLDALDPGATAKALVETARAKVRPLGFDFLDVAVADGTPVLFVSSLYVVNDAATRSAGRIKIALYSAFRLGFYCVHDELGYRAAFRRTVTGLAATLKLPVAPNGAETARFVRLAKIRGNVVGVMAERIFDEGPTSTSIANGSLIFPVEGGGLGVADLAEVSTFDPSGVLVEESDVHADPTEPTTKLHVVRDDPKSYRVDGDAKGKRVDARLRGVDLTSDASRARAVRDFLASPRTDASFFAFDPDVDPTAPDELRFQKADGGWVEIATRNGKRRAKFDDRGYPVVEESLEKTPLVMERVFPRSP